MKVEEEEEVEDSGQKRVDLCRCEWQHSDVLELLFLIHSFSL